MILHDDQTNDEEQNYFVNVIKEIISKQGNSKEEDTINTYKSYIIDYIEKYGIEAKNFIFSLKKSKNHKEISNIILDVMHFCGETPNLELADSITNYVILCNEKEFNIFINNINT